MMPRTLQALLHTLIDYAGLFPPAGLPMDDAVANYASYHASPHAWMLGRFIVPASRLDEFARSLAALGPSRGTAWRVSALVGSDVKSDMSAILAFNQAGRHAVVDTVEAKASSEEEVFALQRAVSPQIKAYVELALDADPRGMVGALGAEKLRAKMRTGGVLPGSIPPVEAVGRFIRTCYAANVAFKATAGLHHPLRSEHGLTYEADSPRAMMHGFLNVFLAAVFHYNGLTQRDTADLLEATTLEGIGFDDDRISWRDYVVTRNEVTTVRRRFAIAFGSCSFREPIDDLLELELLP